MKDETGSCGPFLDQFGSIESEIVKRLQHEIYRYAANAFIESALSSIPNLSPKNRDLFERYFREHAHLRAVERRTRAIKVEVAASRSISQYRWALNPNPSAHRKAEVELQRFNDYLVAEVDFLRATMFQFLPGIDVTPCQWRSDTKILAQLVSLFPAYAKSKGYRFLRKLLPIAEEENFKALQKKGPAKKGRTIPLLQPWLQFNRPVFLHYQFAAKQILALAILQKIYGGDKGARVAKAFKRKEYFLLFPLKGETADSFESGSRERKKADRFDGLLTDLEQPFRKQMEKIRLTGLKNRRRPMNVFDYCGLVCAPEIDTKTVYFEDLLGSG